MPEKTDKNYSGIIFGLLFIALGIFFFAEFASLEKNGGRVTMPRVFVFLYEMGGKWLVSSIFFLIGVIILFAFGNPND